MLITNQALGKPTGTEVYVRDLAKQLLDRGLRPVVYSPNPGATAEELRQATVPVVDNLATMTVEPDVIHGHHTHPTMTALAAFPSAPAVFFCHDWDAWHDEPLAHPRILRHIAVDQTCHDRLVCMGGIAPHRVVYLPNWADVARFRPRGALPPRPRRALVFSNLVRLGGRRDKFRIACRAEQIEVEAIGLKAGRSIQSPEQILGNYDIVFARGKCAFESLAVGAAVVLYGFGRLGPLVTSENFDELRSMNFGRRAIQQPLTVETIRGQLAHYDSRDAGRVAERVRDECDIRPVIDQLIALYQQVIEEQAAFCSDPVIESQAMAAYLARTQMMVELGANRWMRKQREAELRTALTPNWLTRLPLPRSWRRAA